MARRAALPGGTWKQTSEGATLDGGVLRARLKRRDGSLVDASVNVRAPTFANVDGSLVPSESEAHLLTLSPSSSGGPDASTVVADIGTAAEIAAIVAGIIAA